jgi:hypothetical protein
MLIIFGILSYLTNILAFMFIELEKLEEFSKCVII